MRSWTKVKLACDPVVLYQDPGSSDGANSRLLKGMPTIEVSTGPGGFLEAVLPDGSHGFIKADAKIINLTQMGLRVGSTPLHEGPSASSPTVTMLTKGAILTRLHTEPTVQEGNSVWIPVYTSNGQHGFVPGDIKVDIFNSRSQATPGDGYRNMLIGAVVCAIGILVTVMTYRAVSASGGIFLIAWGAILFGAIRFGWGVFQSAGANIK